MNKLAKLAVAGTFAALMVTPADAAPVTVSCNFSDLAHPGTANSNIGTTYITACADFKVVGTHDLRVRGFDHMSYFGEGIFTPVEDAAITLSRSGGGAFEITEWVVGTTSRGTHLVSLDVAGANPQTLTLELTEPVLTQNHFPLYNGLSITPGIPGTLSVAMLAPSGLFAPQFFGFTASYDDGVVDPPVSDVREPAGMALLGAGLAGMRRQQRRRQEQPAPAVA